MRSHLLTIIFSAACVLAFGQVGDSVRHHYNSLRPQSKLDSTTTRINNRVDSIQLKANNILNPDLSTDKVIQRIRERKPTHADSLRAVNHLDSIKGGLQRKIDSLSSLNLPADKYRYKLDSINQFSPAKYLTQVQGKSNDLQYKTNKPIDDFESQINNPVNNLEGKVNDKLTLMNQEGGAGANLPGAANVSDMQLPGAELKSNVDLKTGLDLNIPGVGEVPNPLGKVENPLNGQIEQLSEVKGRVTNVMEIPQQQVDRLTSIDAVQNVQDKAGVANGYIDKAQAYQQDVSHISNGDFDEVKQIPQAIEDKVAAMEEVKDMQNKTGEMTQYQDMLSKGNDPEALKEFAKEQSIKYATDHFAGKQDALKGTIDKLGKLKSKHSQVSSLQDLPKRAPNPMKDKPLMERVVPGFIFQIQKASTFLLDLNPVVSYRLTGRLSAGMGWNERISFSEWNKTVAQDRIFGPRLFSSFGFRKGFSLKAEVEKMNVYLPTFVPNAEGNRAWVWSVFAGFKKDYTFHKNIRGNVQVLYNLYDDHDNSPYIDRLNVRMGWEFPMKKRRGVQ